MPLLELRQVTKSYAEPGTEQTVPILREASLAIQPAESVAIVGPSGCGKSTVLNLLGTLDQPDEGEVIFDGQSLRGASPERLSQLRRDKIGFIFQLHHLLPQCTVLENVVLPALAGDGQVNASELQKRGQELLAEVGLTQRANWRPAQLSGGERQRVAVVRALMNQPKIILADEPTGALDEANAKALTDLMLHLVEKSGITLVMVSHNPAQAQRMQRTLRLHEGGFHPVDKSQTQAAQV